MPSMQTRGAVPSPLPPLAPGQLDLFRCAAASNSSQLPKSMATVCSVLQYGRHCPSMARGAGSPEPCTGQRPGCHAHMLAAYSCRHVHCSHDVLSHELGAVVHLDSKHQ